MPTIEEPPPAAMVPLPRTNASGLTIPAGCEIPRSAPLTSDSQHGEGGGSRTPSPLRTRAHASSPRPREISPKLAGHAHAFLRLRLFLRRRLYRQLQHGGFLTFTQECQEQRLSIGRFERVVVHMR